MKIRGFSLIELSIVLVILSLVVAGVVGGRALVRQAELQAIIREVSGILTGTNAFRIQYDALPGDFKEGAAYWGAAYTYNSSNGNGIYNWQNEEQEAWWHLAQAELFPSNLLNWPHTDGGGGIYVEPGFNALAGSVDGSAYWFSTGSVQNTQSGGILENLISLGIYLSPAAGGNRNGVIIARDARSIDLKIDDGLAGKGKMKAVSQGAQFQPSQGCATTTGNSFAAPVYLLDDQVGKCVLYFTIP